MKYLAYGDENEDLDNQEEYGIDDEEFEEMTEDDEE
jgi:hypothetical protein